jgi:aryl-alcohol dehydrogenase-like predicted oxidoreductase
MKFRKLGTTDIDVSLICLGTMTWGTQNTEKDAFEQMDYSVSQGINFFDTAEIYSVPPTSDSYGKTEVMIGNWFEKRKNRDKIILASKVAGPGCGWIRGGGNNFDEKKIGEAIDGSLKRLKTDYIDLYQLHWPERSTNYFGSRDYSHNNKEGKWNSFEDILSALSIYRYV